MVTNEKVWCQSVRWWLVCERPEAKQSGCTVEAKRHQTTPPPVPMPAHCCRLVMQCDASAANSAAAELHLLLVKPTHQSRCAMG